MNPEIRALAEAHMTPLAMPEANDGGRDNAVMIRYDGMTRGGVPIILAVISDQDLAKLPPRTMKGLKMLSITPGGDLKGSSDAFFRRTTEGVSLYVDTEKHQDFIDRVINECREKNMSCFSARGDLRLLLGSDGDVSPPAVPAFMTNGFQPVAVKSAVEKIHRMRRDIELRAIDNDYDTDSVSPGF